ncbi:hypothetical protein LY76DRAFT_594319 [Colletotrichum caudatum]|nr:hypothetical protein LY76DRAFT_594319 [Colletotrichum caudatum]
MVRLSQRCLFKPLGSTYSAGCPGGSAGLSSPSGIKQGIKIITNRWPLYDNQAKSSESLNAIDPRAYSQGLDRISHQLATASFRYLLANSW